MKTLVHLALVLAVLGSGTPSAAIAQDLVAVVSAKSPVKSLNPNQLADIFLGKTARFPDGNHAVPIDYPEDSPLRDRFYTQFTGKSPAQVKAHWSKVIFTGRGQPPRQVGTAAEAKKAVAENPNAIGYIDQKLVDDTLRIVALR